MSDSKELSSLIKSEISCPEFTSRFQVQSILGSGAFSTVFCVKTNDSDSIVAVKISNRRSKNECSNNNNGYDERDPYINFKNKVRTEIDIHTFISSQNHPNIVKLLESFEYTIKEFVSTSKLVHAIVLEYCELGTLQQYLKRVQGDIKSSRMNRFSFLPEEEVRFALRQLLRALSMIHAHAIVHRDVKPENILLTASSSNPFVDRQKFTLMDCVLKLSDFGLAVKMKDDDDWNSGQKCPCGTPVTMAPEVILAGKQKRTQTRLGIIEDYHSIVGYGQPADLWSTGVIQYLMLVGHFPFISSKPPSLKSSSLATSKSGKFHHIKTAMQEVVKGTLIIPSNILISTSGNDLLHQLLNKNPTQRGFARGILSTHVFFSEDYLPFSYSNTDDWKPSGEILKWQKRIKTESAYIPNSDVLPMIFQFYKDIDEMYTYEYTVFILPNKYGAVIQASKLSISPPDGMEDNPIGFFWCHVVQSGEWYSFHQFDDERNDIESGSVMIEAFANAPQNDFWQSCEMECNLNYLKDLDHSLSDPIEDFQRCNYCHISKASGEEMFLLEILYDTLTALTKDMDVSISMVVSLNDGECQCTAYFDCNIQRSLKMVEILFEDSVKIMYSLYEEEGCVIDQSQCIGTFGEGAFGGIIAPNDPLYIFSAYLDFAHNIILKLVELYQHELCLQNARTKAGIECRRNPYSREYRCVVRGKSIADWVLEPSSLN